MVKDEYRKMELFSDMAKIMVQLGEEVKAIETIRLAMAEVEKIQDEYIRAEAMGEVAQTMAQIGELEQALTITKKIGEDSKVKVLIQIANGLIQEDKAKVTQITNCILAELDEIKVLHNKAKILGEIAMVMIKVGERRKAIDLINRAIVKETINYEFSQAKVLADISNAMSKIGEKTREIEIANQTLKKIEKIEDDHNKTEELIDITKVLARVGNFARARDVANKIKYWHAQAKAEEEIARKEARYIETDKLTANDKVIELDNLIVQQIELDQTLVLIDEIQEEYSKAEALAKMAKAIVKTKEKAKVIEIANRALMAAYNIKILYRKSEILGDIAKLMAQIGEFDRALIVVDKIRDYSKIEILGDIAIIAAQQRQFCLATAAADKIQDDYSKADVLIYIVKAMGQIDDEAKAIEMANQVLAIAVRIKDEDSKSDILGNVGQAINHIGQSEQTLLIMRKELVDAQKIGLQEVLKKIGNWAPYIAFIDKDKEGEILWNIYEALIEVDGWWN